MPRSISQPAPADSKTMQSPKAITFIHSILAKHAKISPHARAPKKSERQQMPLPALEQHLAAIDIASTRLTHANDTRGQKILDEREDHAIAAFGGHKVDRHG